MKNNKLVWGVLIAVAAVVLIVYGVKNKGLENGVVKIGVIGPFTGDAAAYGEPYRNVVALAAEEINAAGGINGQMVELIYEDGKCNGGVAASAMQKLVNVDKVQVVIGGFCSSESLAAVPIAEGVRVFLFSPGSSSPDLTGKSPYFSRNYPSDATQGKVLAQVTTQKGWKKIAFIQEQLDYPLGIYKAFSSNFRGTIVKEEFPTQTSDFRSFLTKLRSQNPDALFVDTQTAATAERILKQMQDLKWKPAILVSDAVSGDTKTVEKNKTALEGALAAEFGVDSANQKFQHLKQAYKVKYNEDLPYESYAQTEYDALFLVRDGIEKVGYNGQRLAQWVRTLRDWQGASGATTIGSDGDRTGGHVPKVIRNGKVELLK